MPNKIHYLILAICIFIIEVGIAKFVPTDTFVRSSLGDFLVVLLVYCAVKAVITIKAKSLAIGVFIFAAGIEISQYYHLIDVLGIENPILRIALGNTFTLHDMLMYLLGCIFMYYIDIYGIMRKSTSTLALNQ